MEKYDIVTVGGGLSGSALSRAMAEHGARVLVVERDREFKDRVRGEALAPWGVGEARTLGVYDLLAESCGHMTRYWQINFDGQPVLERDFFATTTTQAGFFNFYHPAMQQALIEAAARAGAEVRRGARVRGAEPGASPRVTIEQGGVTQEVSARIVVGADGRGSMLRQWGNFSSKQDPDRNYLAGLLLDGMAAPDDRLYHAASPTGGRVSYMFPQGKGRVRAYVGYFRTDKIEGLSGEQGVPHFKASAEAVGIPAAFFANARVAGPLATFPGADCWVDHPYRDGIALIGDAAATSDQTWGQGMSLGFCDARVLRDCLLADDDWDRAGHAYAERHDRNYGVIHRTDGWYTEMFMETGPQADARRAHALPLLLQDPTRIPDAPIGGPDAPCDEQVRRRFFGEE